MLTARTITVAGIVAALFIALIGFRSVWWPGSTDNTSAALQGITTELGWDDLIPDDFEQPENPFNTMTQEEVDKLMDGSDESNAKLAELREAFNYAPVVTALDGLRVKIPAYVTPLEYNADSTADEFLLVPYVGACLHTPPPPANQVVHAKSDEPIAVPGLYEAVWAIGTIKTETITSDLAESGYQLSVEEVLPYSP